MRVRVWGEEQNGFCVARRVEDMFVANELIESKKRGGGKLQDKEKAYDRVNRDILCRVLGKIGLSDKILIIVRSIYVGSRARYWLGNLETGWVKSKRSEARMHIIHNPGLVYTKRN